MDRNSKDKSSSRRVKRRTSSPSSATEPAIRQLRKRLKMLRDYHVDTLSHRAGDVELAVESVIFEQLMRHSKEAVDTTAVDNSPLQSVLTDVQAAVHQLAQQRERDRLEHERLMEQYGKLVEITEAMSADAKVGFNSVHQLSALVSHESNKIDPREHARVLNQLNQLRTEYDELLSYLENKPFQEASELEQLAASTAIDAECESLRNQIAELTSELAKAREASSLQPATQLGELHPSEVSAQEECIASLRQQLLQERQTIVELRLQIDDLRDKLEKSEPQGNSTRGPLSWDQQKVLLLQKLEGESSADELDPNKPLEIHALIERTDREIARRDGEILELKRLLAEQSTASQSIAIGAAAVAELLDHDDFIREERENLRSLQEQWRAKLREAEVEISLERAKIARQRSELEERMKDCERSLTRAEEPANKASTGSRWLSRLGLTDNSGT